MALVLIPITPITAVKADRQGASGEGPGRPVGGTALHNGPRRLAPRVFAAWGHRQRRGLDGGRLARRLPGANVLQRRRGQAVGDPRGPRGRPDEPLGGHRVGQQGAQGPDGGGLAPLAATRRAAWTRQGSGAQQRADGARVGRLHPPRLSPVVTRGLGRDQGRRVPFEPTVAGAS